MTDDWVASPAVRWLEQDYDSTLALGSRVGMAVDGLTVTFFYAAGIPYTVGTKQMFSIKRDTWLGFNGLAVAHTQVWEMPVEDLTDLLEVGESCD